jgi:hypothetical protein
MEAYKHLKPMYACVSRTHTHTDTHTFTDTDTDTDTDTPYTHDCLIIHVVQEYVETKHPNDKYFKRDGADVKKKK